MKIIYITCFLFIGIVSMAKVPSKLNQTNGSILSFRVLWPDSKDGIEYTDLDQDGDPDLLKYTIRDSINVMWIDDDDDMLISDWTGDLDSDCLLIDLDNNGEYGAANDLVVDWNDEDGNGIADMQAVLENGELDYKGKWKSHFMYFINTDDKGIFNFIDWNTFKVEGWEKEGRCNFMSNYHGNSLMLKVHISSFDIEDIRYNWENPFLFYDEDDDGYSEMAIRLVDEPAKIDELSSEYTFGFTHNITLAQLTFDLDNDNGSANEIDYDMSLKFQGPGFNYSKQVHKFESMIGLNGTAKFFLDPRFRQQDELIYCDHDSAYKMVCELGDWTSCWLVFDEDDDCHRWERVEFYDPKDPANFGSHNNGLDDNPQADVAGDRGEWDQDFSGNGNLYISSFDNKIHLFGAETGYWRIDQFANYYQGWQGWRGQNPQPEDHIFVEPDKAPLVKYSDTNGNGFFDLFEYDMDSDGSYEEKVSLLELGLSDECEIIQVKDLEYADYTALYSDIASKSWNNAMDAIQVAKGLGIETSWYNYLLKSNSIQEKYSNGYWLSFYIYHDIIEFSKRCNNLELLEKVKKAYFTSNWQFLLN